MIADRRRTLSTAMFDLREITRRDTFFALLATLPARPAFVVDDAQVMSIAIADFADRSSTSQGRGHELASLIASDLRSSGRFTVPDLAQYSESIVDVDSVPKFDLWRAIRIDYLVTGAFVLQPDGRERVEFRLWDVAAGQLLASAQYFVALDRQPRVPHVVADAILERLTGQVGGFDTGK